MSHTFSIFDTNSIIYRWNKGENVELNEDFLNVLKLSKQVNTTTAYAYATAFMVLGYEKSTRIVKQHPELEAWFIIAEGDEKWKVVRN